jgi:hypothetical protein
MMASSGKEYVARIRSHITGGACPVCNTFTFPTTDDYFEVAVNHLRAEHRADLRHVGQETSHAAERGLWHSTVAVLKHR